jgi:hypothetical protein
MKDRRQVEGSRRLRSAKALQMDVLAAGVFKARTASLEAYAMAIFLPWKSLTSTHFYCRRQLDDPLLLEPSCNFLGILFGLASKVDTSGN